MLWLPRLSLLLNIFYFIFSERGSEWSADEFCPSRQILPRWQVLEGKDNDQETVWTALDTNPEASHVAYRWNLYSYDTASLPARNNNIQGLMCCWIEDRSPRTFIHHHDLEYLIFDENIFFWYYVLQDIIEHPFIIIIVNNLLVLAICPCVNIWWKYILFWYYIINNINMIRLQ